MRNKILILAVVTFIISLSLVNAADTIQVLDGDSSSFTFKQNSYVDIKIRAFDENNNLIASNGNNCTISIDYPDGTILVNNGTMQANNLYYNYTLVPSETLKLGKHSVIVSCVGSTSAFSTFTYDITPSGNTKGILGLYIILFLIAYLVTFAGAYWENYTITMLGGIAMIVLGLFSLINGIDIYRNNATEAFSLITAFMGAYFALTAGVKVIEENL